MPQYINDPALLAQLNGDPFEDALKAEGLTGKAADVARSIYQQESSSGKNTKTSNQGYDKSVRAVGGMQILPGTFKSVADKGWDINDPTQNARAGIRYVKQLFEQAGGDPALTAAGYYGGPGGLEKARRGVAVSDPRNPSAPTTLQYGQQVASRLPKEPLNPVMAAGKAITDAVVPSANAAEPAQRQYIDDPELLAQLDGKPAAPKQKSFGELAYRAANTLTPLGNVLNLLSSGSPVQDAKNVVGGGVRGAGSIGATILAPVDIASDAMNGKGLTLESNKQRRADMDAALTNLGVDTNSGLFQLGKTGAEIAGTGGVGNLAAAPLRAAGLNGLATAVRTGGAAGPNMLTRVLGGGINGGLTAGLIDPSAAGLGAGIGAALPPSLKIVGAAGNALGSMVRPFTAGGQNRIVGDTLREFATDPAAAQAALASAREVVPGSAPIAATAAGDDGIAALSRAMQNASPEYASNLAARQTAQNQARTAALEDIAGNTGKIDIARKARDALTGPMREEVLDAAGKVPSDQILSSIDRLISNPSNAGKLSQQALNEFKGRIAQFSQDGEIDARALYAIRKDINDVLQGKLQGEAGNIKYAAGQLGSIKGLIDDAIDQASRGAASTGTGLSTVVRQGQVGPATGGVTSASARPTWRGYLDTYAKESIPIDQMKQLDKILKDVQTGTVDSQGGLVLSAAKLNNLLKNKGSDLMKELSPEQLDVLRRIQADLNAGQIASNTGRAVGSNTVQNLAQNQLLQGALGRTVGGSTAATSTLGRLLQLPYGAANKQIQERLGNALLNPQEGARLLQQPENNQLLQLLSLPAYRSAPVLADR